MVYRKLEIAFEKFSMIATRILGNSITFLIAALLIVLYFTDERVYHQPGNKTIMDIIFSITFLSIFIIQKTVNRLSIALQLKMNELVAAHDKASNKMINIEDKTEEELKELSKYYSRLVEKLEADKQEAKPGSIDGLLDDAGNKKSP